MVYSRPTKGNLALVSDEKRGTDWWLGKWTNVRYPTIYCTEIIFLLGQLPDGVLLGYMVRAKPRLTVHVLFAMLYGLHRHRRTRNITLVQKLHLTREHCLRD